MFTVVKSLINKSHPCQSVSSVTCHFVVPLGLSIMYFFERRFGLKMFDIEVEKKYLHIVTTKGEGVFFDWPAFFNLLCLYCLLAYN
jgi:hypothetical protein